jgi:hypothetical protein
MGVGVFKRRGEDRGMFTRVAGTQSTRIMQEGLPPLLACRSFSEGMALRTMRSAHANSNKSC